MLLVWALHGHLLGAGFVNWDDDRFIYKNPLFLRGGWQGVLAYLAAALTEVQFQAYHPLHLLSYLPDRALWPRAPAGFHLLNVGVFSAGVLCVHALARRHADGLAAWLAAALFAVHPLCVESVAWISARKDLLALAFFFAALLVEDATGETPGKRPFLAWALSLGAYLSKTSAVCFPALLWAWLRFVKGAPAGVALRRAAPHAVFAAAAAAAVPFIWRQSDMIRPDRPATFVVDVAATLGTHLGRMVWPSRLAPVYPEAAPGQALAAAAFAGGLVLALSTWKRLPGAARYAAAAVLICLLPVSNALPLYYRFADRYALLALAALVTPAACLVWWVGATSHRARAIATSALVALLVTGFVVSRPLGLSWHDSRKLWMRAATAQPHALFARLKLAETLRDGEEWIPATEQYLAAIRINHGSLLGYAGLFHLQALRAERQGLLPAGTAGAWLRSLGQSMNDRGSVARLMEDVTRAGCGRCSSALLWLALRRWPLPDTELLDQAEEALRAGAHDAARVLLGEVRDRQSARLRALAGKLPER